MGKESRKPHANWSLVRSITRRQPANCRRTRAGLNVRVTASAFDAAGAIVGGGEGRLGTLAPNATADQPLTFVAERAVASAELFAVDPSYVRYLPRPRQIG